MTVVDLDAGGARHVQQGGVELDSRGDGGIDARAPREGEGDRAARRGSHPHVGDLGPRRDRLGTEAESLEVTQSPRR
jgi:hypothetical protein